MPVLQGYYQISCRPSDNEAPAVFGQLHRSVARTGMTGYVRKVAVGTETTVTVYDVSADSTFAFSLLGIAADFDLLYELTGDVGNDNGTIYETGKILGSGTVDQYEFPLIRPSNFCYASDYSAGFAAGTADVIDKIALRNASTTQAAQALVFIAASE